MKLWDITPRKKHKPKLKAKEKREKKKNRTWFFFIILIGAFFIAFFGAEKTSPSSSEKPLPTPVTQDVVSGNPLIKPQNSLNIKLLNQDQI